MTIKHFIQETSDAKARQINEHGTYLQSFFINDHLINVYSLSGFFVEVVINIRKSVVEDYIPFEGGVRRMRRMPFDGCIPGKRPD